MNRDIPYGRRSRRRGRFIGPPRDGQIILEQFIVGPSSWIHLSKLINSICMCNPSTYTSTARRVMRRISTDYEHLLFTQYMEPRPVYVCWTGATTIRRSL